MICSLRRPAARCAQACIVGAFALGSLVIVPTGGASMADAAAGQAAVDPSLPGARPAAALASSAARSEGRWAWPIDPPHRILSGFQAPQTRYSAGHRGIDIAASAGAAVRAPSDAEVYFSGTVVDRPVLTLETDAGVLVSMEPVAGSIALHTRVRAGDVVGTVGSGGHCDRGCVHLGVRVAGAYVSPLLFLGGAQRAVLLPLGCVRSTQARGCASR